VPGAIGFLERVRALGGLVAVVTNRGESQCEDTRENLRSQSIPFDVLLCRPDGVNGEKEPRWEALEAGTAISGLPPVEILVWVGDNIGDFPDLDQSARDADEAAFAPFGERYFILPNPVYGSWENNPER
jgi:predicted secreted acid phosphatase